MRDSDARATQGWAGCVRVWPCVPVVSVLRRSEEGGWLQGRFKASLGCRMSLRLASASVRTKQVGSEDIKGQGKKGEEERRRRTRGRGEDVC